MANVATLTAKMVMDVSGFSTGANKVITLTQGIKTAVGSLAQTMLTGAIQGVAMAGAFSAMHMAASGLQTVLHGIASEVQHGFGLAMAAESAQIQFKVLLGSAEKAKELMKDINSFALATPFSVSGATESVSKLMGVGVPQERMMSTMRMLGEISGGSTEKLGLMAHTYGEVMSKQRVLSSEMNQIAAVGINMRDALAKEAGVGVKDLTKAIEAGKVSAIDFHNALHELATGKFAGSLEEGAKGLEGSLNRLKEVRDSFSRDVALKLSEKWGLTASANDIANFAEGVKMMTPVVVDAFAQMGDAVFTFVDALRIMGRYAPSAADLATGSPMAALGAWSGRLTGAAMVGTGAENINTKGDLQKAMGVVKGIGAAVEAGRPKLPESKRMEKSQFTDLGKAMGIGIADSFGKALTGVGGTIGGLGMKGMEGARGLVRSFLTPDVPQEQRPTGALVAGSSEAFSAIIRSMTGADKGKPAERTAKATEETVKKLDRIGKDIVDAIKAQVSGVIGAFGA